MIFISHRGNLNGKKPNLENSPTYIDSALLQGYDCEVDAWMKSNEIYLGHDGPEYHIDMEWLEKRKANLWIHCKNYDALSMLFDLDFHCFFHNIDAYTITSHGFVWAYPGMPSASKKCISVMPERKEGIVGIKANQYVGICSDIILSIKQEMEYQC